MRWTGWYRRNASSPWQVACRSETLEDCSRELLQKVPPGTKCTDRIITGGGYPMRRRRGRDPKEHTRE